MYIYIYIAYCPIMTCHCPYGVTTNTMAEHSSQDSVVRVLDSAVCFDTFVLPKGCQGRLSLLVWRTNVHPVSAKHAYAQSPY